MSTISSISSSYQSYTGTTQTQSTKVQDEVKQESSKSNATDSAVYTPSSSKSTQKTYKQDTATIAQLKADAERRTGQLKSLVEKLLTKQGSTYNQSTDIYALLREGKVSVDPETAAQAKKDISEDGYWGVKQTSERIVSFAKALTGSDPSKADEMIKAVEKGFKQATKAWGDDLPSICKDTYDAAMEELKKWRDSANVNA